MDEGRVGRRAVPVYDARLAVHDVAYLDPSRAAALVADPAAALEHVQGLTAFVAMPVRASAGREMDGRDEAGRSDRIVDPSRLDAHVACVVSAH